MAPSNIKLLQSVGPTQGGEGPINLRVLVNDTEIKYITVESGVYKNPRFWPKNHGARIDLPPFPGGDWNQATVWEGPYGVPYLGNFRIVESLRVGLTWHSRVFNYVDLQFYKARVDRRVYKVQGLIGDKRAVAKFARFDDEIEGIERETRMYYRLQNWGIGPEFLGHVVEEGRVIGFLLEDVGNVALSNRRCRRACAAELTRLHNLDLLHGGLTATKFLFRDGRAYLIGFKSAHYSDSPEEKQLELELIKQLLKKDTAAGA